MNNPYVQRVYQKLAHAKSVLSLAAECGTAIPERQQAEALLQAAVLHLSVAYRFFLRELAYRYNLARVDVIVELEGLRQVLLQAGKVVPEVTELEALESDDVWLACLLAAEREALNPSVAEPNVQQVGLIAVSRTPVSVLSVELVGQWCQRLSALSERHRESGAEF